MGKKQLDIPGTERVEHPEIEETALALRETQTDRMRLTEKEVQLQARLLKQMEDAGLTVYELNAKEGDDEKPLVVELVHTDVKAKVRQKDPKRKKQEKPAAPKVAPEGATHAEAAPEPVQAGDVLVRVQDGRGNLVDCPVEKCGAKAYGHCRNERGEEARGQCHAARLQAAGAEVAQLKAEQEADQHEAAEERAKVPFAESAAAMAAGAVSGAVDAGQDDDEADGEPAAGGATRAAKPKGRSARKMAN